VQWNKLKRWAALAASVFVIPSCGSSSAPATPTPTGSTAPVLTAPQPDSPSDGLQLSTLRPTLIVRNGTSDQAGARSYEFQVSDRSDFASTTSSLFAVVVNRTGVPEGSDGRTSLTLEQDLQPTTRFYWRSRIVQGTAASAWSATRVFNSKLVGYNRAGELYDPLIHGETIGTVLGSTTWVAGKGIRLNDGMSIVRYRLMDTISNGEFSVEIEGLHPNGPGGKLKVLSMSDTEGNLFDSKFMLNAQYRGVPGNPDNCIAFKALFGDSDFKLEPDIGRRTASVQALDPSRTYYWKVTWGTGIHVLIQSGGIGGATIYDYGLESPGGAYNPSPHYAYLGANNAFSGTADEVEEGTYPGLTYRNLWIGNRPRPASLGSALAGVNRK
jgi:hypothetical protein